MSHSLTIVQDKSEEEEATKAAQVLVYNDALYQFVEWLHSYGSHLSSLRIVVYDSLSKYQEACRINNAKSDLVITSSCHCTSGVTTVEELGSLLKPHGLILKLSTEDRQEATAATGSKILIVNSHKHLCKLYDYEKRTWNNYIQSTTKPVTQRPVLPAFHPPEWTVPLIRSKGK